MVKTIIFLKPTDQTNNLLPFWRKSVNGYLIV